jgi:hypothetical protein
MRIRSGRLLRCVVACTVFLACTPAHAGIGACAVLVDQFSPNDVSLAYTYVSEHGECIANFEDPAFQAVSGTLTSLTTTGVLHVGQCSSILNNKQSQAAKQLLAIADANVVGNYLGCGCAVADSGIAQKIQGLVEDVVACAKSIDPTAIIADGMEQAGDLLGMSTLWGMAGPDHDPRAGVGNGGAPTEAYEAATCSGTGVPIGGRSTAWDNTALPPGQRVRTCNCPAPTRVYADDHFVLDAPGIFHGPSFRCMACPPNTAKDSYGNCSVCVNKSGPTGFETWEPNKDGTACEMTNVQLNCTAGSVRDNWGEDCHACPANTRQIGSYCQACPAGTHSEAAQTECLADKCSGGLGEVAGSDECMVCPPDTSLKPGGICQPCPAGAHSKGGTDFCSMAFPSAACPAGTVHPDGDAVACVCAPGTQEVNGVCQAVLQPMRPVLQIQRKE